MVIKPVQRFLSRINRHSVTEAPTKCGNLPSYTTLNHIPTLYPLRDGYASELATSAVCGAANDLQSSFLSSLLVVSLGGYIVSDLHKHFKCNAKRL